MNLVVSTGSGSGHAGWFIASAFGLFFAVIGSLFVAGAVSSLRDAKAMQEWTKASCTISSSQMEDDSDGFRLAVVYNYTVNGINYTAQRYSQNKFYTAESVVEIDQMQKRLSSGQTVDCYYNPANPAEAVLKIPSVKGAVYAVGFTLFFPSFGILFAILPWLGGRRKNQGSATMRSGKRFLIPFGSVFLLIGLLTLNPLLIRPFEKMRTAKTWSAIPATVISSKVKSHDSDDGTTYSVYIAYRYRIGDKEYLGDRYTFMSGSSSGYEKKAEVVRHYPKGQTFDVYVNPVNPAESVVKRGISGESFLGLLPLVFVIIGATVMIAGFRVKKTVLDTRQMRERSVVLKSGSPVGRAVGVTSFAIVWNGVVFAIFKSDAPVIFHIVFGFFGICMIAASVYTILSVFSPRVTAEITPGNVRPGTDVSLRWFINGRVDRIAKLSVALQCLQIMVETRQSGGENSTRTVKIPQYEKELLQTGNQREITRGTVQFQIPENVLPSRPADEQGEIRWQVVFRGDISFRPNLKQEFVFIVFPEDLEPVQNPG